MKQKLRKPNTASQRASGWTDESDQNEAVYLLYDDLVRSRNRLAGLPPATPQDLERVEIARHEVAFHLMTPPLHVASDLPVSPQMRAALAMAASDAAVATFSGLVALIAQKLAVARPASALRSDTLAILRDAMDALTFDYRTTKKETLALLRAVREELDGRVAYVRGLKRSGYRFAALPELYGTRADRKERPDQFFERVYRPHVPRGLTQADIRLADSAYYNVLHVWCSRHGRSLASLVPPSRRRG